MKKILIKFAIFLVPIFIVYFLMEWKLNDVVTIYKTKRKNIEAKHDSIEVLVLGSSHAFVAVNPAYLSHPTFNLGCINQSTFYDMALANRYYPQMHKLKLVLLTADFITFFYRLHETHEEWRDYYYWQYWDVKYPGLPLLDSRKFCKFTMLGPSNVTKFIRNGFKLNMNATLTEWGWAAYEPLDNTLKTDSTGLRTVKRHTGFFKREKLKENVDAVENLVKGLREKGIEVAFITYPVCSTYYKNAPKYILAINDSIVTRLCSTYNCKYYNYFKDQRMVIDDFCDNDHLLPAGAAKFSKILDAEVIRPILGDPIK